MSVLSQQRVLVAGVGYQWCGDASWGLKAVEALAQEQWPAFVEFTQFDYGAIYVSQELAAAQPPYSSIWFLCAVERDREHGSLRCYEWQALKLNAKDLQARIREAGAGVIDLDHLLAIAHHFQALPKRTFIIEFEPADLSTATELSAAGKTAISEAAHLIRQALGAAAGAEFTEEVHAH
jgi:hydrogenase maturation protease